MDPEKKFKSGVLSVTIWRNPVVDKQGLPGSYYSVSFERGYKTKEGTWKNTTSLRINDLPRIQLLLSKAYEYLILNDAKSTGEAMEVDEETI